jgi:uncharacterized protein YkwD
MNRLSASCVPQLLLVCIALVGSSVARADALDVVQVLREGGCGGILPASRPLQPNALLNRSAELWAAGRSLAAAVARSGYSAEREGGLHVAGSEVAMNKSIRRTGCRAIASSQLRDVGVYRRGMDTWFVVASAYVSPARSEAPALAERALLLVKEARARGAQCGRRTFAPAPPLRLSGILSDVASEHAVDMAEHNYFDHIDLRGASPADRIHAVGYRERLVGENIAYGVDSVREAVQGWLHSPEHCENMMDPRFSEMGIGYAAGTTSRRGLYWVQLLTEPRN